MLHLSYCEVSGTVSVKLVRHYGGVSVKLIGQYSGVSVKLVR